jgi:hypothetical protein
MKPRWTRKCTKVEGRITKLICGSTVDLEEVWYSTSVWVVGAMDRGSFWDSSKAFCKPRGPTRVRLGSYESISSDASASFCRPRPYARFDCAKLRQGLDLQNPRSCGTVRRAGSVSNGQTFQSTLRCSRLATYDLGQIGHLPFAVKEVSHDLQPRPQGPRS